jgi:uncharacterized protein (DUF169 family)
MNADTIESLGRTISDRLRLRTLPLALKLFEDPGDLAAIPRLKRPQQGIEFTMCQIIGQARWLGRTIGVGAENLVNGGNCGGVLGLNQVAETYLDGTMFNGVWFGNREAAIAHQEQMPRVSAGKYAVAAISPVSRKALDAPDTVLFYATPGQTIILINALQFNQYARYDFTITGETACADSWGLSVKTSKPVVAIPCYAERRFGGVFDDELLVALPPQFLESVAQGLEGLGKNGLFYPIAPYSVQNDPGPAFQRNYAEKLKPSGKAAELPSKEAADSSSKQDKAIEKPKPTAKDESKTVKTSKTQNSSKTTKAANKKANKPAKPARTPKLKVESAAQSPTKPKQSEEKAAKKSSKASSTQTSAQAINQSKKTEKPAPKTAQPKKTLKLPVGTSKDDGRRS